MDKNLANKVLFLCYIILLFIVAGIFMSLFAPILSLIANSLSYIFHGFNGFFSGFGKAVLIVIRLAQSIFSGNIFFYILIAFMVIGFIVTQAIRHK
ncbi:MAG: hypothetical protein ACYCTB_11815 [bacterium]